ncbi:MAG: LON peptidase substrate-binding domain-containing protein [Bdellovibrionota bacterium]
MLNTTVMPYINIRGLVVFPHSEISLMIGRSESIAAIKFAISSNDNNLVIISQKKSENNGQPILNEMFKAGTLVKIEKHITLDDAMKIHCSGVSKVKIEKIEVSNEIQMASVTQTPYSEIESRLSILEKREILALTDAWCSKLQNRTSPDITDLESISFKHFVERVLDIITYFDIEKKYSKKDIIEAAKTGLGQTCQKSLDTNKELINYLVSKRQEILESESYTKQIQLTKKLLKEEINLFDANL